MERMARMWWSGAGCACAVTGMLIFATLVRTVSADVPKPVHAWNFDRLEWRQEAANDIGFCDAKRKRVIYGRFAAGQGVGSSVGMVIDGKNGIVLRSMPLTNEAFTIDMAFRLFSPLDGKTSRTLWHYACDERDAGHYRLVLAADGRLVVSASSAATRGGTTFTAQSEPQEIKDGVCYAVRLSVTGEGRLDVWLDGLRVIAADGAPSLRAVSGKSAPKSYPRLVFGAREHGGGWARLRRDILDGAVDDISLYDAALGAPVQPELDYSSMAVPEYRADVSTSDVLILDAAGKGRTGRFRVLDHDEGVLGEKMAADDKFIRAASTASVEIENETMKVTVDCPVPAGLSARKSTANVWTGDRVEVSVRPSAESPVAYWFYVNAAGRSVAEKFNAPGAKDAGWKSKAAISTVDTPDGFKATFEIPLSEMFAKPLGPGDTFGINFNRIGATCSGESHWSMSGGRFNANTAYGTLVYGGSAAYFARRMGAVEARCAQTLTTDAARAAAERAIAPLKAAIAQHGADQKAFGALEAMFSKLERSLLHVSLGGAPILLFQPKDVWGSAIEPDETARPLETVRLRAARNGRVTYAFAIANLTEKQFLGQIKMFDKFRGFARRFPVKDGISERFSFSKGFYVLDRGGRKLYDPIEDLPMGTVMHLAPGETAPLYLELDTTGLKAGRYHTMLMLRPSMPGFRVCRIGFVVDVADADLSLANADKAGCDDTGVSFRPERKPCPGIIAKIVERGYNFLYITPEEANLYPRLGEDGVWRIGDYGPFDQHIEAFLAAGLQKERMKLRIYISLEGSPHSKWARSPTDSKGKPFQYRSEKWCEGIRFMVQDVSARLKERYGVGKDRIYWLVVDEPSGDIDDPCSKIGRAYWGAKEIKAQDAANLTFTDPLPNFLASKDAGRALTKLVEVYDVIQGYRPFMTKEIIKTLQSLDLKEVWTYHISCKTTSATVYRRGIWQNLRDGFRECVSFWHLTEATSDPFDMTDPASPGRYEDYASLYVDWSLGTALLSRRQLAADIAAEDAKIVLFLRRKFKDDPAMLAKVEALVKQAADIGTMSAMDAARDDLLALCGRLDR